MLRAFACLSAFSIYTDLLVTFRRLSKQSLARIKDNTRIEALSSYTIREAHRLRVDFQITDEVKKIFDEVVEDMELL
jgi:hypothetical protein